MYKYQIHERLIRVLKKLSKKDNKKYNIVMKKIGEIVACPDVAHYKNLRSPLNDFKRVHIDGSFVMVFKLVDGVVKFFDLDHHDNIYRKKFS